MMNWRRRVRGSLLCVGGPLAVLATGAPVFAHDFAQDQGGTADPAPATGTEPAADANPAAGAAAEVRFDIMEFEVNGNTVLKPEDIQLALMPHAGFTKTVPDVEAARVALEKVYRERGYATVVVEVPQQDVSSGIVKLSVVEGRVGQVRVTGADYVLPSEVRGSLPSLSKGAVPNVPQLQTELTAANSRATRTITPEFKAGMAPGTVDIDLTVDDKRPWGLGVEVSDQYNRSTERLRLNVSGHYDNLFQAGHSASLFLQTAPQDLDQVQVISGSYFAPIGYSRTSLLGYFVQSNTDVATVGGLAVIGNGLTFGGRVMRTLGNSPKGVVQTLMVGFDYKDYLDQIGLVDPETKERLTFDTPVTYLPFTAQYRWLGGNSRSNGEFTIGTTFAFDGVVGDQDEFGGRPDNPLLPGNQATVGKRDGAQASFLYLHGSGAYSRKLTERLDLHAALDWQISPRPLISNEQFTLGGVGSVRGYREAEVLGDSGGRLSLELGYTIPFGKIVKGAEDDVKWRVAGFVEGGYAWNEDPLPEEESKFAMGSVGLTTRFDVYGHFYGQLDLAYQFRDDPTKSGQKVPDDFGGMRGHFKIGLKY